MSEQLTRAPDLPELVRRAHRMTDYVRLTRPGNALGAAALVLAGSYLAATTPHHAASGEPNWAMAWLAACAMWCITAHGYASNDVADVTEDRINKPDRPLPSGQIAPQNAQRFAQTLALLGIALAVPLGLVATAAALAVIGLLRAYNRTLKDIPGVGNGLIGILAGSALVAGAIVQVSLLPALQSGIIYPAAVFAAAITAREILKTLEDVPGDLRAQRHTLATTWGPQRTLFVYTVFAGLACLLMALPIWRLGYAPAYLVCSAFGVGVPLLLPGLVTTHRRTSLTDHQVRPYLRMLKLSYAAGILALFLA